MGYADKYYYGQGKIIVNSNAQKVTISDGSSSKEITTSYGVAKTLVPPRKVYTVTANNKSEEVYIGFGTCKEINL